MLKVERLGDEYIGYEVRRGHGTITLTSYHAVYEGDTAPFIPHCDDMVSIKLDEHTIITELVNC